MSNAARHASGGATYRMLRELGARTQRSFAAIREPDELCVVQRFVRVAWLGDPAPAGAETATPLDAEAMALLLRDARCLAKHPHANIGRVLHAEVSPAPRRELMIATELYDGSTLADLIEAGASARGRSHEPPLALPVVVRILLDVLAGLAALHALRDGIDLPLGAIHGALCPASIVVGKDGGARIVDVLRRRPVRLLPSSEAFAYASPEALGGEGTADPRSDVYSVGVILWEALAGRRLDDTGAVPPPSIDPLARVAVRALSADPDDRFAGPTEMAAAIEAAARSRFASHATVAGRVLELMGSRIRLRRATLVPTSSGTRRRASERAIRAALETLDADELPGPRGSSPQIDLAVALALAAGDAAPEPPVEAEAPELEIPIEVTATLTEAAPVRARAPWPALVVLGLLGLLVIAGMVAGTLASRFVTSQPPSGASSPRVEAVQAAPLPAPPLREGTTTRAEASAIVTPPPSPSVTTAAPAPAAAPVTPRRSTPVKKKSVYEPDGP